MQETSSPNLDNASSTKSFFDQSTETNCPNATVPEPAKLLDKIAELEMRLEDLSKLSVDFVALLAASTLIATFGLFENSAAVIIGAMIIAPLMRPLVGLSLSLITADMLLLQRALLTLSAGSLFGVTIAFLVGTILHEIQLSPEILARTKPTLLDLGIAVFAGAIGAYCQSNQKLADSLAGVSIAVALVPPLSVVGIGLALNQSELWQGAGLLYLTNLVGITISGALVFLAMGYAPLRRARKGLLASLSILALLAVPLAISMNALVLENRLGGEIRRILKRTHTFKDVRLRDIEIRKYHSPPIVLATVFTDQQITGNQVCMVQDFLMKELRMPLEFRIKVIPVSEVCAIKEGHGIKSQTALPIEAQSLRRPIQQSAQSDEGEQRLPSEIEYAEHTLVNELQRQR